MKCKFNFKISLSLFLVIFTLLTPAVSIFKITVSAQTEISSGDYRFECLDDEEQGYYNKIYSALSDRSKQIFLKGRNFTDAYVSNKLANVYFKVLYDNPELYYAKAYFDYEISVGLVTIKPSYLMTAEQIKSADKIYEEGVAAIIKDVKNDWTTVEKVLYVHDYIASNFSYDDDLKIFDPYNFFKTGKGVCQAYALTFTAALRELDIPVSYVISYELRHMWNIVEIDGEWYNVDVTWDDYLNEPGKANHYYFLQSDKASRKYHESDDWEKEFDCDSKKYDEYIWKDVATAFVLHNDEWYGVDYVEGGVFKYDLKAGTSKKIFGITNKWQHMKTDQYWEGCYSGLSIVDGLFIYNTDSTLLLYDAETNSRKTIVKNSEKGYIYGFTIKADELIYYIRESPEAKIKKNLTISVDQIPKRTTVRFMLEDIVLEEKKYWDGNEIKIIDSPDKAGYKFTGWSPEVPEKVAAEDLTFTAVFSCLHEKWDEATVKEPDCVHEGEKKLTCTTCGETKKEAIKATQIHNYGQWVITRETTRKLEGERQKTCVVCAKIQTEAIEKLPPYKWYENPVTWIIVSIAGVIVIALIVIIVIKKKSKASRIKQSKESEVQEITEEVQESSETSSGAV